MNLPTETSIHTPDEFGFWIDTRERTDLDYMTRLEQVLSIAKSLVAQWAEIAQIPHSGKEPFFRQLDFGNATADFKNVLLAEVLKRWMRREGMALRSTEQSETSTLLQERPEEVDNKIIALFEAAKEEIFEDGMESKFSGELTFLIKKYGNDAIEAIAHLIIGERVNAEVASEALRSMGRIDHLPSLRFRLWLLEKCLSSSSPRVRDGAVLGLAFLDDHHAIDYLKRSIQQEPIEELREAMEQVVQQLESPQRCLFS